MRNLPFVLLCLLLNARLAAQSCTFFSNMMLYPDAALNHLKPVADSLQKNIPPTLGDYRGERFAIGRFVSVDSMVADVCADLNSGLTLAGLKARYPFARVLPRGVVTTHPYRSWEGYPELHLQVQPFGEYDFDLAVDTATNVQAVAGKWVLSQPPGPHYARGVFFEENMHSRPLPERYARMVRYVDALVDTNTTLFLTDQAYSFRRDTFPRPARDSFFDYIQVPGEPQPLFLQNIRLAYVDAEQAYFTLGKRQHDRLVWQLKRDFWIQDSLSHTARFNSLLHAAVDEAIRMGVADPLLEDWAWDYGDRERALQLMRLHLVWSDCGNDGRPAQQVFHIARHAAMAGNWPVFIRAHLYLVNDQSDWSVRSKSRFVAELETLSLDVPALLIGSVLRIQDPARNHFHGGIERTGRALADCQNSDAVERLLREAIADPALDDLNRLTLFQVYRAMYLRKHWPKEYEDYRKTRAALLRELEPVAKRLPGYLAQTLKVTDD